MLTLGGFEIPEDEITFTYARSSGSGGQNVNKVSSKAILRWHFGSNSTIPNAVIQRFRIAFRSRITAAGDTVVIQSETFRDQPKNKEDCLAKLSQMLLSVAKPPKRRLKTRPTHSSVERRMAEKRRVGEKKKQRKVTDSESV